MASLGTPVTIGCKSKEYKCVTTPDKYDSGSLNALSWNRCSKYEPKSLGKSVCVRVDLYVHSQAIKNRSCEM